MSRPLRMNTATRVTIGPFQDVVDGVTPLTSLTATSEHLTLVCDVAGVPTLVLDAFATASSGTNDLVHIAGDDAGLFDLELTAAQLNYAARALLCITNPSVHPPVFHEFVIETAEAYDARFTSVNLLNLFRAALRGDNAAATDLVAIVAAINANLGSGVGNYNLTDLAIPDPAAVRAAIGLAAANLDAKFTTLSTHGDLVWATPTGFAVPGDQMALTNTERQNVAAVVMRRTMANVENAAVGDALSHHSLYGFIQQAQKSGPIIGGLLPIYKTDGVTLLGNLTLTGLAGADPIVGVA